MLSGINKRLDEAGPGGKLILYYIIFGKNFGDHLAKFDKLFII